MTDLLDRAAEAVRARYDGQPGGAATGEARLLEALRKRNRRRSWLPLVASLPLLFAVSVAWGTLGPSLRSKLFGIQAARHQPVPAAMRSPRRASSEAAPEIPAAALLPTPPAPSSGARDARPVRIEPRARPPRVSDRDLSSTLPASETAALSLYRAAHRAQFAARDPAQAVQLWQRYLSAAPNGALSPEARYNYAIALLQLGRTAEAVGPLQTFARGDYGPYRQAEARALLENLQRVKPIP